LEGALAPEDRDERDEVRAEEEAEEEERDVEAGLRAGAPSDVRLRVGALDRLAMSREYP
jgi:hypothetical protein